jgi:hypothetical protein
MRTRPLFSFVILLGLLLCFSASSALGALGTKKLFLPQVLKNWPPCPTITNLQYNPKSFPVNTVVTIIGTIDFSDESGDVLRTEIKAYSPDGSTETIILNTPSNGRKVGIISISAQVMIEVKGITTFEIQVIDQKGFRSNKLTGTFDVY